MKYWLNLLTKLTILKKQLTGCLQKIVNVFRWSHPPVPWEMVIDVMQARIDNLERIVNEILKKEKN